MLEADADPAGQAVEGEEETEMGSRDLKAEVLRLTLELQEATEEKLQAARYGLVVLEESAALKMKHRQLEEEHETLKGELQQLKEVGTPKASCLYLDNSRLVLILPASVTIPITYYYFDIFYCCTKLIRFLPLPGLMMSSS